MTSEATTATTPPPDSLAECPYRGLRPYGEEDADYYFGRDAERDLVIANLMASRLTVLYGASGVGKSSLLRAGVLRLMRRMPPSSFSYLAAGTSVIAYHASWRQDPLMSLGDALRRALPPATGWADPGPPAGPLSVEMVRDISRRLDADVYLVLDQFEEASLYLTVEAVDELASELGRIVDTQGVRASVLLGIREDALAKLDAFEAHVPGLFDNMLRLDHLDAQAAREAIEQPLERYNEHHPGQAGVTIEGSLVDDLILQLRTGRLSVSDQGEGGSRGQDVTIETPFLQLVMTRLWAEERMRGSDVLRLATLHELGDAERIVRTHLDTVMAQLTQERREIAAEVFRFLVTPSGTKVAHTAEDLSEYAGMADTTAVKGVLEELSSGRERILRPVEPPVDRPGAPRYEVFHDVLAPAVLDWRRRFVAERDRQQSERVFLERQEEEVRQHQWTRRRLRRARLVSAAMAVLLVLALGLGVMAKRNGDAAQAAALLSRSLEVLPTDPGLALELAVRAHSLEAGSSAETAVRVAYDADRERLRITAAAGYLNAIAFAPDGRTFVAAGSGGEAFVYDVGTGKLVRRLTVPGAGVNVTEAVMSPDGSMLALSTDEPRTLVFEVATGRQLLAVDGYDYYVQAQWALLDGRQILVTGGGSETVQVWTPTTGTLLAELGDEGGGLFAVSPDGSKVVIGELASISVWKTATGELLKRSAELAQEALYVSFVGSESERVVVWLRPEDDYWTPAFWDWQGSDRPTLSEYTSREPSPIASSADGAYVALALDRDVRVYGADDANADFALPTQPDLLTAVRLSPDAGHLVTAGVAGQALVWSLYGSPEAPSARLVGHRGEVADARFSPTDPSLVLTSGYDGTVRLWQLPSRLVAAQTGTWMRSADVSPDGSRILSLSDEGKVQVARASNGELESEDWIGDDLSQIDFLAAEWLPDGKRAVAASQWDLAPWVWDPDSEPTSRLLEANDDWTRGLSVSPDGELVAMGDMKNRVVLWDTSSGDITDKLEAGDDSYAVMDVEFVPESQLVAAASVDGTVRLWDVSEPTATPRTLGSVGAAPVVALGASDDGLWIAAASVNRKIFIYRVADGELVTEMAGPSAGLSDLVFGPGAEQLVGAGGDGTVRVWERSSGTLVGVHTRHSETVNTVEFMPDGKRLVTASDDGTSLIFSCTTCDAFGAVLQAAEDRLDARDGARLAPLDRETWRRSATPPPLASP